MTISFDFAREPSLFFANEGESVDPRAGLVKYGPIGIQTDKVKSIQIGLISTREDGIYFKEFFSRISDNIAQNFIGNTMQIDFPGLGEFSPLKFEFDLSDNNILEISTAEINTIVDEKNRIARAVQFLNLCKSKMDQIITIANPRIEIIIIIPPQKLLDSTKPPGNLGDRVSTIARTFGLNYEEEIPEFFDFHHALKAYSMTKGIASQLIRPATIQLRKGMQDFATTAWNLSVAMYYKATDTPWKLADIDDKTCYVGISFYQEITKEFRGMRTAMAQVFLRSGESQVIRGKPFKWDPNISKSPELTSGQANEILSAVIDLYKNTAGDPDRIVIHKTSSFSEEEIEGFDMITEKAANGGNYIHIRNYSPFRSIPTTSYPPLRGMNLGKNADMLDNHLLYTTGFTPALNTYMGSRVPAPLQLTSYRQDSGNSILIDEIMSLSKLDWNNTNFNGRLPVTLGVSQKVGSVLAEVRQITTEPQESYRFYM